MRAQKQLGFTIIELVVVIALLGLLAAVALPRFASMEANARTAAYNGVRGAFTTSVGIAHSKWLAVGTGVAGPVALDGDNVEVNATGWPFIEADHTDQDTADELYAILMQDAVPSTWQSCETASTASADAGTGSFELDGAGGSSFVYAGATGIVITGATDGSECP